MKKKIEPMLGVGSPSAGQDPDEAVFQPTTAADRVYGKGSHVIQPLPPDSAAEEPVNSDDKPRASSTVVEHAAPSVASLTTSDPGVTASDGIAPTPAADSPAAPPPSAAPHRPSLRNIYPEPRKGGQGFIPPRPSRPLPEAKPPADAYNYDTSGQLPTVFLLATVAGGIFYFVYDEVLRQTSAPSLTCNNSFLTVWSCNPVWVAGFFTALPLFSLMSYFAYRRLSRGFLFAFWAAALSVALFFYAELSGLLSYGVLNWLAQHTLVNRILLPAIVAGSVATVFSLLAARLGNTATRIVRYAGLALTVFALFFVPYLRLQYILYENRVADAKRRAVYVQRIHQSSLPLYLPKGYGGPLKLAKAFAYEPPQAERAYYSFNYSVPPLDQNKSTTALVSIYKGSLTHFSPPTDCGIGRPWLTRTQLYPCHLALTTVKGRRVYADTATNYFSIQKDQPNYFYVPMGDYVVSFANSDITIPQQPAGILTAEEVAQFADSLHQLTGSDLTQFANKYFTTP